MMSTLAFLILLSSNVSAKLFGIFSRQKVVKELDVDKYLGTWYEAYASIIQKRTFQRNGVCTTATYSLMDDKKTIKVVNAANPSTPGATRFFAVGTATSPSVGKFIVQFPQSGKVTSPNYFVLRLGPVVTGQYDYAVIGSPYKMFCWILVRDVKRFNAKYKNKLLVFLKRSGYSLFYNKPRVTYQGAQCNYE